MIAFGVGGQINVAATLDLNGSAEDLTGATISAGLVKYDRTGLAAGTSVVSATIVNATAGSVTAVWPSAQTGTITPGRYLVEFKIVRGSEPVYVEGVEVSIFQPRT